MNESEQIYLIPTISWRWNISQCHHTWHFACKEEDIVSPQQVEEARKKMFNGTITSVPQAFTVVTPQLNSTASSNSSVGPKPAQPPPPPPPPQATSVLQSLPCQLLGQSSLVLTPVANGSTVTCAPLALTVASQVRSVWTRLRGLCILRDWVHNRVLPVSCIHVVVAVTLTLVFCCSSLLNKKEGSQISTKDNYKWQVFSLRVGKHKSRNYYKSYPWRFVESYISFYLVAFSFLFLFWFFLFFCCQVCFSLWLLWSNIVSPPLSKHYTPFSNDVKFWSEFVTWPKNVFPWHFCDTPWKTTPWQRQNLLAIIKVTWSFPLSMTTFFIVIFRFCVF